MSNPQIVEKRRMAPMANKEMMGMAFSGGKSSGD
jgi:hypothetical protein